MGINTPLAFYGNVNIPTEDLPMFTHPLIQRLRHMRQLGEKYMGNFPSANHTRFEHSLRVYEETKRFVSRSDIKLHPLTRRALPLVGLAHDVGHPPLSHSIEKFFGNHDDYLKELAPEFKSAIKACGVDYTHFYMILTKTWPESKIIFDKNFGIDKLDYLVFDALYCNYGSIIDAERIKSGLMFRDDMMMSHIKNLDLVKELQKKYLWAYLNLYCSPDSMLLSRITQKIITLAQMEDPNLLKSIRMLCDHELLGTLCYSFSDEARIVYSLLMAGVFPKLAIEFLYEKNPRLLHAPFGVVQAKMPLMPFETLDSWKTLQRIFELEAFIAQMAGLEPWQVFLVCQDQPQKRFISQDAYLFNDMGETFRVSRLCNNHIAEMKKMAEASYFMNLCVFAKEKNDIRKVQALATEIRDYLKDAIMRIHTAKMKKEIK